MKWLERIYAEENFARSVATTIAGIVGLIVYLLSEDWVIALFSLVIIYPPSRIIASFFDEKIDQQKKEIVEEERANRLYNKLSDVEKGVVQAFVRHGGCVMTWAQWNRHGTRLSAGIESLRERGFLKTSTTADTMRETFVLDQTLFDAGQRLED